MNACKELLGLSSVPTPTDATLYAPGSESPSLTSEQRAGVRIKTICGKELQELLDARRASSRLPQD